MLQKLFVGISIVTIFAATAEAQNKGAVLGEKIERLQQQMLDMQKELDTLRTEQKKATEAVKQQQEDSSQQIQAAREDILDAIARGAEAAGRRRGHDLLIIADRRAAMEAAFEAARPGDIVLLAGKGHERTIIGPDGEQPWDEAAVATELLAEMGYRR